jgi:pimeloyl-ACP methyl ester carboxylesterase
VIKSFSFLTPDHTHLAWHEFVPVTGSGRIAVLIHGYFSDAHINWIKYGHAALLVNAGFRVIMPDLRGHGHSAKPHNPRAYPADILVDDQFALIEHLGLTEFDICGYSLGGRTVARMLVRGCTPRRAVIAGMGLAGLTHTSARAEHFRHILTHIGQHERGSPAWMAEAFLKTTGGDPIALRLLLDSFVDTSLAELWAINTAIAIVCGDDDYDNGSSAALADAIPAAQLITIPGNHMSAVAKPELGSAIAQFLTA